MLANSSATDTVTSPGGDSRPRPAWPPAARPSGAAGFLRAFGHCWQRALLAGVACAAAALVPGWLALSPGAPTVAARPAADSARERLKSLREQARDLAVEQRQTLERLGDAQKDLREARTRQAAGPPPGLDEPPVADADWARLQDVRARILADVHRLESLALPGRVPPKLTECRDALAGVEREIGERPRARQSTPQVVGWSDAEERLAAEARRLEAEGRALTAVLTDAETLHDEITTAEAARHDVGLAQPAATGVRRAAALLPAGCGLVVVMLGFTWREYRSGRVRAAADVARELGLPLFGTLPAAARAMRRRLAGGTPPARDASHRRLTEAADTARTLLLHATDAADLRTVVIAGAAGAEGTTSLAVLLAVSLARAWRRTLLIDANLRRPGVARVFGLAPEPGLAEVLRGEAAVEQVVQSTPVSRLWALPAGRLDDYALQALAQDNVGPLLAELRAQYDFVVIDTAPVLPVADALMLGRHADAALLAVLCGASRLPQVEAARARLEAVGVTVLGAVVAGESATE